MKTTGWAAAAALLGLVLGAAGCGTPATVDSGAADESPDVHVGGITVQGLGPGWSKVALPGRRIEYSSANGSLLGGNVDVSRMAFYHVGPHQRLDALLVVTTHPGVEAKAAKDFRCGVFPAKAQEPYLRNAAWGSIWDVACAWVWPNSTGSTVWRNAGSDVIRDIRATGAYLEPLYYYVGVQAESANDSAITIRAALAPDSVSSLTAAHQGLLQTGKGVIIDESLLAWVDAVLDSARSATTTLWHPTLVIPPLSFPVSESK